jgi:hypothetical protein
MPKYIIEREITGTGKLRKEQLEGISQKSCRVLKKLGPQIQWLESYVTDDKVNCVYIAPDEAAVREHAKQGGFPANRVSEVKGIIDPTTAEAEPVGIADSGAKPLTLGQRTASNANDRVPPKVCLTK